VAARVAPRFEEVRFGNVPMAQRRRLIVVLTQMGAELHLVQRVGEFQVGRRRVDGIAAHDQQYVHSAGVHVGDEVANRRELIDRLRFDGLRVDDGLAGVAERGVHRVRERVDRWRLMISGDDEAGAAMRLEIFRNRVDPFLDGRPQGLRSAPRTRAISRTRPTRPSRPNAARDRGRDRLDLARLRRQAMIGTRSGRRRHRFDRIEPVHPIGLLGTPARGEVPRVPQAPGSGADEVGVERQDHVSAIEPVLRVHVFAKREFRAGTCAVAARRIPLMPFRGRVSSQHIANLRGERRRVDRLGEDAQPRAFERRLRRQRIANRTQERRPRPDLAEVGQRLRPVRIVEPENRRLREHVARAEAARMQRIPLDLGRAAFVTLDQQSRRDAAERHRRGEEQRFAGNEVFGLADVRNDLLQRLSRARRDARERQRGAHQLEERAPRHRIGDRLHF
jgi:hypothetical protein